MNTSSPSIEKIGFKTGAFTFLALVTYFMIMKLFGLSHILELRFFNFVILAFGISYGINKLKRDLQESDFYLKGWAQGIYIAVVSVILFSLFMSIYLSYFDEPLMQRIRGTTTLGFTVASGFHIFFAIFMEGMASAVVITLGAMQYFKSVGKTKTSNTQNYHNTVK
jgi:hypothetical protein